MPTYQFDKIAVLADYDDLRLPCCLEYFIIWGIPKSQIPQGLRLDTLVLR